MEELSGDEFGLDLAVFFPAEFSAEGDDVASSALDALGSVDADRGDGGLLGHPDLEAVLWFGAVEDLVGALVEESEGLGIGRRGEEVVFEQRGSAGRCLGL